LAIWSNTICSAEDVSFVLSLFLV